MKSLNKPLAASCLLLASIFGFFGPLTVYAVNHEEFKSSIFQILTYFLPIVFILAPLLYVGISKIFKGRATIPTVILLAISVLLYVEGHVLINQYKRFDGAAINWNEYLKVGLISTAVWVAVLAGFIGFRSRIVKHASSVAALVALLMSSAVYVEAYSNHTRWGEEKIELPDSGFLKFSKTKNVVIIVLDSLNSTFFQRIIDKDPSYAEKFSNFTYYRNTLSAYPETFLSIPTILTSQTFENEGHVNDYLQKALRASLPAQLKEQSFATSLITKASYCKASKGIPCFDVADYFAHDRSNNQLREATEVADLLLFKYSSHWLRAKLFATGTSPVATAFFPLDSSDSRWENIALADKMEEAAEVTSPEPTFKFIHLSIPHPPFVRDEECRIFEEKKVTRDEEIVIEDGYTKCGLKIASRIINRIKDLGIYDQTAIMILSDHGIGYNAHNKPDSDLFPAMGRAMAFMMVKPFNASGPFKPTDAPVSLVDVPATVADMLDLSLPFNGQSVLTIPEDAVRERRYHFYPLSRRDWASGKMPHPTTVYTVIGHAWENASWKSQKTITQNEVGDGPL